VRGDQAKDHRWKAVAYVVLQQLKGYARDLIHIRYIVVSGGVKPVKGKPGRIHQTPLFLEQKGEFGEQGAGHVDADENVQDIPQLHPHLSIDTSLFRADNPLIQEPQKSLHFQDILDIIGIEKALHRTGCAGGKGGQVEDVLGESTVSKEGHAQVKGIAQGHKQIHHDAVG